MPQSEVRRWMRQGLARVRMSQVGAILEDWLLPPPVQHWAELCNQSPAEPLGPGLHRKAQLAFTGAGL